MIKNTTPNIQYSDRIGQKYKGRVIRDALSANNNFHETPLKRDTREISFKGVSSFKKAFGFYNKHNYRVNDNLELLERSLGGTPRRLYNNIKSWSDISKDIKENSANDVVVRTKNWTRLLLEGIVYPVTELPLHIAKGVKETFTGKTKVVNRENRSFLQKKMDILNNSDIINAFSGQMETANKLKYDSKKMQSAMLFTKAMKQFDQKAGNYNGVHERALTRIVTGFIPAFFLANDAYNLSRLCDDDPQKAKVEHDTRFNQEIKRVVSNAYLQLITLGALSKYINSNKFVYMVVTAATVIMTEAYSRLSNGKKIHFISKEQAIEINKKAAQKSGTTKNAQDVAVKPASVDNSKINEAAVSKQLSFKGTDLFKEFGLAADMPVTAEVSPVGVTSKTSSKSKISQNDKPLISPEGITKWFATMIIAGFALKFGKKNIKINGETLGKYFDIISKKYDNKYSAITQRDYKVSKEEFQKVIDKLSTYNKTLGRKFLEVTRKHQFASAVKSNALKIADKLKAEGLDELSQEFVHLANRGKNSRFEDIKINKEAVNFFKNRDNSIIDKNTKEFLKLLSDAGWEQQAAELKAVLYKNDVFNAANYEPALKLILKNPECKHFATTFENRFKIDDEAETIKMFAKALKALKTKNSSVYADLIKIKTDALNSDVVDLGKRNKPVIREAADFLTQPFKFVWGTITLPYKHIANRFYQLATHKAKLPTWPNELEAVSNGVRKLTYKPKYMPSAKARIDIEDEKFVDYMDKRINKAFNDRTMSSVSNADLSALAKNTTTVATAWFLLCDNHNMVMLKSNGEDKDGAVLKAKERAIQETSRTFWNLLFINLFNDTFRHTFNSSLLGAELVNTASTLVGENVNRRFIGMPVSKKSKDEILNKEHENITNEGIKGDFFRFMSRLTGKKVLSERKQNQNQKK